MTAQHPNPYHAVEQELRRRAEKASAAAEGQFGDERDVPEGEAAAYLEAADLLHEAGEGKPDG